MLEKLNLAHVPFSDATEVISEEQYFVFPIPLLPHVEPIVPLIPRYDSMTKGSVRSDGSQFLMLYGVREDNAKRLRQLYGKFDKAMPNYFELDSFVQNIANLGKGFISVPDHHVRSAMSPVFEGYDFLHHTLRGLAGYMKADRDTSLAVYLGDPFAYVQARGGKTVQMPKGGVIKRSLQKGLDRPLITVHHAADFSNSHRLARRGARIQNMATDLSRVIR